MEPLHAAEMAGSAVATSGLDFSILATMGAVVTLALAGWSSFLQSKLASLSMLWAWKNEFVDKCAADRLADVRDYATKAEVQALVTRLDKQFSDVHIAIEKLGDKLDQWKQQS